MEATGYNLFSLISAWLISAGNSYAKAFAVGITVTAVIWIALFVLQGVGLYTMAKNRGMKKKGLAFVPFVNVLYMEKLAGSCEFFGHKVKRAGVYAMVGQILSIVLVMLSVASQMWLYIVEGAPQVTELGVVYWGKFTHTASKTIFAFYDLSGYILSVIQLIYEILLVILLMGLYKRYSPKNYTALGILALFVPASRYIVTFVLRGREAIDFEAYMRARHEAYMRRQQQYQNRYGNPYGSPYQNPYQTPYQNSSQNRGDTPPPEDPFAEFGSGNSAERKTGQNTTETTDNDDGFFQ
ncbi:MAG: hypothetical protein IJX88_05425 [Clostridia bacterium]|nr:hypothetical protein [Clostridia bacterium]